MDSLVRQTTGSLKQVLRDVSEPGVYVAQKEESVTLKS